MIDADAVILALDAGNTRIKWGVHDGREWRARGAIATSDAAALPDSLRAALPAGRATACNVAGAEVRAHIERACAKSGVAVEFVTSPREAMGVRNAYADPAQLGPDRWAALVAAHHHVRGHKLVVNAGTALTVDALTAQGDFLGGLIVPGPALMRRSLDRGTAGLRLTEGAFAPFPRNTPDAITSGAIQAAAGTVASLGTEMAAAGFPPAQVVLSGGAAGEIEAKMPYPCTYRENLVLDGLVILARH
jgi:type III pantothenate kinase